MSIRTNSAVAKVLIRKPPSEVYNLFIDGESMSKFWFFRTDSVLKVGEPSTWFLNKKPSAPSFVVQVKQLEIAHKIVLEWEHQPGKITTVDWVFKETEQGHTKLIVEETGFSGSDEEIIDRALDSTGGFNQVIIAAKALAEYGIEINVVTDHV